MTEEYQQLIDELWVVIRQSSEEPGAGYVPQNASGDMVYVDEGSLDIPDFLRCDDDDEVVMAAPVVNQALQGNNPSVSGKPTMPSTADQPATSDGPSAVDVPVAMDVTSDKPVTPIVAGNAIAGIQQVTTAPAQTKEEIYDQLSDTEITYSDDDIEMSK